VKKILGILVVLLALGLVLGCASKPATPADKGINPPAPTIKVYPPQIIEHRGTAFGQPYPKWMEAALEGPKAVEKLPDYAGKYVVIVEAEGQDLDGANLAASRLEAQPTIAALISTRVKDTFAGAQVGDKDKIETYMERAVKSVSDATFTGFAMEGDWWARLQTFDTKGKPAQQVYRVIQLWTIDQAALKDQVDKILSGAAAAEPAPTPEKQKAMDLVNQSFFDGF
jgi:hypothetical protein